MPRPLVLIVDQDPDMRVILSAFLRHAGYAVMMQEHGDGALAEARERRPALLIGEHPIPLSDGNTLCSALRSDPETANIPFLAVTTRAFPEEVADAQRLHDAVLAKPPDYSELLRKIQELTEVPLSR